MAPIFVSCALQTRTATGSDGSSHLYSALLCTPAVAFPVIVGAALGLSRWSILIAGGAFSVGFGSFQELHRSRIRPMLLATFGMCFSSWIGTLAGNSSPATVCACALVALVYALSFRRSQALSWAVLQCAIWFVISTAYPAPGLEVLTRGGLILAGGLLQILMFSSSLRISQMLGFNTTGHALQTAPDRMPISVPQSRRFAVRAFVTIGIVTLLYRSLAIENGYWAPMTSLIVLRPLLQDTLQQGLERGLGTLAGVAVSGAIIAVTHHAAPVLVAGVCCFAFASYAVFQIKYAYFAACLSAYVVFLLSLAGLREQPLLLHRILFTALGVAVTFVLHVAAEWIEQKSKSLIGN